MDAPGRQRVAMNEATFRKVNEGMEAAQPAGRMTFICECGRLGCNKLIELTRDEYEAVRANPRRFAILDGHEIDEVEDVVERAEGYIVVEKRGLPESEIVEHTDPRRPLDETRYGPIAFPRSPRRAAASASAGSRAPASTSATAKRQPRAARK